jgi:hypothetical protein
MTDIMTYDLSSWVILYSMRYWQRRKISPIPPPKWIPVHNIRKFDVILMVQNCEWEIPTLNLGPYTDYS